MGIDRGNVCDTAAGDIHPAPIIDLCAVCDAAAGNKHSAICINRDFGCRPPAEDGHCLSVNNDIFGNCDRSIFYGFELSLLGNTECTENTAGKNRYGIRPASFSNKQVTAGIDDGAVCHPAAVNRHMSVCIERCADSHPSAGNRQFPVGIERGADSCSANDDDRFSRIDLNIFQTVEFGKETRI